MIFVIVLVLSNSIVFYNGFIAHKHENGCFGYSICPYKSMQRVDTSHTTYESESNKEIFLWNNKNKLLNKFDTNINFPLFVCENMNVLFLDFEVSAIAVVKILYASRFLFVKFAPFCRVVSVRACA